MPTVRPPPRIHMALVSDLAPASWVKVTFRYLVLVCTPQNKLVILFSLGLSNIGKGKARFFFFKFAQLKYSKFFKTFFGRAEFRSQSRSRNQISAEASLKKGRLPSAPASQHLALHYCKKTHEEMGVLEMLRRAPDLGVLYDLLPEFPCPGPYGLDVDREKVLVG